MALDGKHIGQEPGSVWVQKLERRFIAQVRLAVDALQATPGTEFNSNGETYFLAKNGSVYKRLGQ